MHNSQNSKNEEEQNAVSSWISIQEIKKMVNEGSNNTGDSALFNSVSDGLKHPQQAH